MIIDNLTIAAIVITLLASIFALGTRGCIRCSRNSAPGTFRRGRPGRAR